eukprot:15303338-Alexandrium_andersonii.AAC.1
MSAANTSADCALGPRMGPRPRAPGAHGHTCAGCPSPRPLFFYKGRRTRFWLQGTFQPNRRPAATCAEADRQ